MFGGFDPRSDPSSKGRLMASTGLSALAYGTLVALALALAREESVAAVKEMAVVFAPPPPAAPAPPPPPAVPRSLPVKKVAAPRPVTALVEVKQTPAARPEEADPATAAPIEVGDGSGEGVAGGTGVAQAAPSPPPPPPPPPRPARQAPINLPESATPPVPDPANAAPEFPEEARAKGLEGQVILKLVVSERGAVTQVQVLRGEEPFMAAALRAVQSWRFSPALVEGQPTPVFRIIKIPFRLKS